MRNVRVSSFANSRQRNAPKIGYCELTNKMDYAGKLEYLLFERTERIDDVHAKIDQLREQNKRLDQENEHLVEMVP